MKISRWFLAVRPAIGIAVCFLLIGNVFGFDGPALYDIAYVGKNGSSPVVINDKRLSDGDLRAIGLLVDKGHGNVKGPDRFDQLIEQELFIQHAVGKNVSQDNTHRNAIEILFLSHLGMEYFDLKMKQMVSNDAAEVRSLLPAKWVKASVEFVLFPSIEEAGEAAKKVKSLEDFEALKKDRPEAAKGKENLFPASGFFPDYDDVAIFNMSSGGLYGALETGIGPAVLYVREIGEVGESEKQEMLDRAEKSVSERTLRKEMERIQAATPVVIALDNVRKYIRAYRGGYVLTLGIATVAGRTVDTTTYRMLTKKEPLVYLKNLGDDDLAKEYESSLQNVCRTIALGEEAIRKNYSRIKTEKYENSFNALKRRYYATVGEYLAIGDISVSDELVKLYYNDNLEKEFRLPDRVRVSHIFVKDNRKKMEEVRKKLKAGEDFVDLNSKYSEDFHTNMKGGDIGWISRNGSTFPEVEKAVFAKKSGGVTPIVKTPNGYHIFKVLEFQPARTATLEEAKSGIRKKIYDSRYDKKKSQVLKKMRKEAKIERMKSAPAKGAPSKSAPSK